MAKTTYLCLLLSGKKKKEIQLAELTKTDTADPPSCRFHICNLPIR